LWVKRQSAFLFPFKLITREDSFPVLLIEDRATNWFEYVRHVLSISSLPHLTTTDRPVTPDEYGDMMFPIYDYTTSTQVCGIGATQTGPQTKTAKVQA
jgi:hypothetical protein